MKKASEAEVVKTSASTSKAGPSTQPDPIIHPNPRTSDHSDAQPMEIDFCGPSLPPRFTQSVKSDHGSKHWDLQSEHSDPQSKHSEQPQRVCSSIAKKHSDKKKHKVWAKYYLQSSSSGEDQSSVPVKKSVKPQQTSSEQDQQQDNPDPVFYREVEMTVLQPHLGDSRCQELRNLPFWPTPLFKSQLVKNGEDFLLKTGTPKDSQGFGLYQNKPFRGPHHNKKRGSYRKHHYGGNSSQSSNQSFSSGRGKSTNRGFRGCFRPHSRGRGRGNPSPQ